MEPFIGITAAARDGKSFGDSRPSGLASGEVPLCGWKDNARSRNDEVKKRGVVCSFCSAGAVFRVVFALLPWGWHEMYNAAYACVTMETSRATRSSEANDSQNKLASEACRMDVRRFKEFCQRLDELWQRSDTKGALTKEARSDADQHRETPDALSQALSEIERLRSDADQHRETPDALSQALSEIERLRSDADQHRATSNALRDALAEIERLRSDAADLHHTKFDLGLSNLPPASIAADWFMKFSERKQALIGEKAMGRKSDAE